MRCLPLPTAEMLPRVDSPPTVGLIMRGDRWTHLELPSSTQIDKTKRSRCKFRNMISRKRPSSLRKLNS
jgi:hypothetical protein